MKIRTSKYLLNEKGAPYQVADLTEWAEGFEKLYRAGQGVIAHDVFSNCRISTAFLGVDYNFGEGPPVLWETMVFGGPLGQEQLRCAGNREQAEAQHQSMVKRILETGARKI